MPGINARPQLNGNPVEDFEKSARAIYDAAETAQQELQKAFANVFHGRNYQAQFSRDIQYDARRQDEIRMQEAFAAAQNLKALALQINRAAHGMPEPADAD